MDLGLGVSDDVEILLTVSVDVSGVDLGLGVSDDVEILVTVSVDVSGVDLGWGVSDDVGILLTVSVDVSGVDLGWGVPAVDGGWVSGRFVGWTNGVFAVLFSTSILLVLAFVVSETPPPAECFILILPVLITAVVVYSSVRGVSMDADPSSGLRPDPPI